MRRNLTTLSDWLWRDFPLKLFLFLVFLYCIGRAYFLSITHDEALTILSQRSHSYLDILIFFTAHPANNHLLNSLLVKFFINIFGYRELPIRFSALIGTLLYLVGSYKLCKLLFSKTLLFPLCLLTLVLNPFVIDFQSLARGYSLALGFLIFSLFYFFNSYDCTEPQKALTLRIKSFCAMSLAVLSNFSFLNVYLAIIGSYCIMESASIYFLKKKKESIDIFNAYFIKNILFTFNISIFLLILICFPLSMITKYNLLYGGKVGFFHDTVSSLVKSSLYGKSYLTSSVAEDYFIYLLLFVLVLFIGNFLIVYYKKSSLNSSDRELIAISLVIGITALSIIFQNILLNIPFIWARSAIYFIPLFTLFVFLLWKALSQRIIWVRVMSHIILIFCIVMVLCHYISCLNLEYTYDWRYDASTNATMDRIFQIYKQINLGKEPLTIGASWWLVPSIDFYLLKHGGQFNIMEPRGPETVSPDGRHDFYYLHACEKEILKKYRVIPIDHYALSDTYLGVSSSLMSK